MSKHFISEQLLNKTLEDILDTVDAIDFDEGYMTDVSRIKESLVKFADQIAESNYKQGHYEGYEEGFMTCLRNGSK